MSAAANINAGADHTVPTRQHFGQAALCWEAARQLISAAAAGGGDGSIAASDLSVYVDVLEGNERAVRQQQLAPYSLPPARLAAAVRQGLWVGPRSRLELPSAGGL